ncbi:MAG: 4-alpha-glucanotransferase [Frankiales bacterium]|nr:4-alpha-glucanotransferase [Frankiales bacterium]
MTLEQLAAAHGVATSYDDWAGRRVEVPRTAVTSALAALDVDGSTDEAVESALREREEAAWSEVVGAVLVLHEGQTGSVEVVGEVLSLTVLLENGAVRDLPAAGEEVARRGTQVRRRLPLPALPTGYHTLEVRTVDQTAGCTLIVVPSRLPVPDGRYWGWQIQLYAMRSQQSWGVGDYRDLRTVVEASAADGAGALLVNPLHAETPVLPVQPSPYSPSSRLFRSALALRVQDVPEYAAVAAEVDALRPLTDPERIDRDSAWEAKFAALEVMWPRHRVGALADFRALRGEPLETFALFCAVAELHGGDWSTWPEDLQTPSPASRAAHEERVAFWCWVQLLVDEQLAGIGDGLPVGVVHDLAVGVDAGGADAWAMQDVLALGTSIGAPPDSFNQKGQDWGLPPWRPDRLRQTAYLPFRQMVQGVLRHAGGIRVDHVMGLARLWWVPAGADASEGTYVSYDAEALLGVLALEAQRAGAVVVGEDLGTVQPTVRRLLDRTGVLGSAVLWFETSDDGWFLPPSHWRRDALASVTTHDLPTAAGWLAEEHVRVRHELGQLGHSLEQEQARVRKDRELLLAMLRHEGLLEEDGDVVAALHRALVASPCRIVLAAYGDAVGDLRQPNLPGTIDEYPNWRLPVADGTGRPLGLEELLAHEGVRRLTALLQQVH